jgi:hypothetical protein
MAGLGYKVFTAGEVLTAANVNGYLMEQSVMVFAGTAARGSAIGTASEGMVTYLSDSNSLTVYDGSNWKAINGASVSTVGTATTAYTAVAGDANNVIYSLATAAATITIDDIYSIGDRIDVWRDGAGTVTLAAGTGVTSWAGAGTAGTAVTFKIDQQYNAATVQKVAANTYRVVGKITA